MNSTYNVIASTNESTVVTEYTPQQNRSESYQSEAQLEAEFIRLLGTLGYEYLTIHNETTLIANLRKQLELLNHYTFTDSEWDKFFKNNIASANDGIVEKTRKIQLDYVQTLIKDDGLTKNIYLLDKKNIHNNRLQVINQYEVETGNYKNRYDVTILVNGLPLVHVELKRRGVTLREAFNQIDRYQRNSFWADSGLFQYVQIFVISNGTHTKYYSNTTRENHCKEINNTRKKSFTSNSFEFTSFWADSKNKNILDLVDFTKTFFYKHTLLNILTKFCVFTTENLLLVMRPYQISACERILNKIEVSTNYKQTGTVEAGGYIWHSTGSGKTLSSFKTAQLASNLPYIDKVLFVVDRKDLDYQTMKEYDRFEKGCANSNTSTAVLQRQLEDPNAKIIITTIQKLGIFIKKNKGHEVFKKHIVIMNDECHRSNFGEFHDLIVKNFKNYHLFGWTGTPIFAVNASSASGRTTPQYFGGEPNEKGEKVLALHTYTVVDAINDHNVLPFKIDYVSTLKEKENIDDVKVKDIDREKALASRERIEKIVSYILEHFDTKTSRTNGFYQFSKLQNIKEVASAKVRGSVGEIKQKQHLNGFNAIFAVASIEVAKKYYQEFKRQMAEKPNKSLKVGVIYSFGMNEDVDVLAEENPEDTSGLDKDSRDFLEESIKDYNKVFGTNYDTSSDKFQNYYKDVSLRMKNRELDLLIVVNMFLTGFDSTTVNTLWVDKNLRYHGLIQAFSRTNRILNRVKAFGNIICFRDLQKATEDALALFGDKDASGIVLLKSFEDYYLGYDDKRGHHRGYKEIVEELLARFPLDEEIKGEQNKIEFIKLFGALLRVMNILSAFDEFAGKELISARKFQDYTGKYIDLKPTGTKNPDPTNINNDVVFEVELIKQVEVNIDYILLLVEKYHKENCQNREVLADIQSAIGSSAELRSKKELIESFIASINPTSDIDKDWKTFVIKQRETDLNDIIEEEKLKEAKTKEFMKNAFKDGEIRTSGTVIDELLPPVSIFGSSGNNRQTKKLNVIERLMRFFDKYRGLYNEQPTEPIKEVKIGMDANLDKFFEPIFTVCDEEQ